MGGLVGLSPPRAWSHPHGQSTTPTAKGVVKRTKKKKKKKRKRKKKRKEKRMKRMGFDFLGVAGLPSWAWVG
jgi:CelD/BcsL family acetyltransferase involved in cellulose biosynthesis